MPTILITGGSGLIGSTLIPLLRDAGHQVRIIGRTDGRNADVPGFKWDIQKMTMDGTALEGVTHIIHLAGAGIADGRWTAARKEEIVTSRMMPMKLLADTLSKRGQKLDAFITASGIGYYGAETSAHIFKEDDAPADDFLGKTCRLWEEAVQLFDGIAAREVRVRTGIVLDSKGGALPKLMAPAKLGLAANLGSGKQWTPWIHIEDICRIYLQAVEDTDFKGAYNAVAPEHATQKQLLSAISAAIGKPFFLPGVPSVALKLVMGDMSQMLTEGSRVSCKKLEETGFEFQHPVLKLVLEDLLA
ncbi:MAG: TIGR01777 family oxidoreductase [Flavobacteriales bacterium]|nr:TIGR01777 family oxidoreductase [Flavobacteriales bacterium]